jgi:hypothetical protein
MFLCWGRSISRCEHLCMLWYRIVQRHRLGCHKQMRHSGCLVSAQRRGLAGAWLVSLHQLLFHAITCRRMEFVKKICSNGRATILSAIYSQPSACLGPAGSFERCLCQYHGLHQSRSW